MWLREPVLILTISVAVLGLLFAIRRILAEATVVTSSDGAASDKGASRGTAGVIARPPLIFLGFLAFAAVLEALVPSPTTTLFPHARYVAGAVFFIVGLLIGIAGVRDLRAAATNISTDLPTTTLVVYGVYGWSRNPLYLAMALAYIGLRSEEHTSELQSPYDLVCRLLLEKKKKNQYISTLVYHEKKKKKKKK